MHKLRAYRKENVSNTVYEAFWLMRLLHLRLLVSIGLKYCITIHNREVKELVAWRKDFEK